MYKIVSEENQVLAYVDKPNYVKMEGGQPVPCVPVEAVGVSVGGRLYNLLGHSDIEGASTVVASMVTDGESSELFKSLSILLGE